MMREPVQVSERRKSQMDLGETYFWTASIHKWNKLLWNDSYKDIIINSWDYLSGKGKIDVFGFVIMPTHLHCIWRMNEMNGREKPHASFMKFTAHTFERKLLAESPRLLKSYRIKACDRQYHFWQRDSLAVRLYNHRIARQKLNYIHQNPLGTYWQLVKHPCDYKYSSAPFYEYDQKNFSFLKDLWQVFPTDYGINSFNNR